MKNIVFILLLLASCATKQEITIVPTKKAKKVVKSFKASDYLIRPGEMAFIRFADLREGEGSKLVCRKDIVPFYRGKDGLEAFVVESYFSRLKPFSCVFKTKNKTTVVANFIIEPKTFPSEKLSVDKKKIFPPKKALIRIRKEQKFLNKNYAASPSYPLFTKAFKVPLDTYVTSIYGSKRLYNNKKQSQHLGIDYRAAVGVPIYSANSGKVVVARNLYYTGNTVTLDHGLKIFTIYGHMSKLNVTEGDYVPKGSLVGWAGATGRVTGPHLHWGVKVYGNWIEGNSLVKSTQWMEK